MRLSANFIVNYASVNQFEYAKQWKIRAGDQNNLYFQLVDLDQTTLESCRAAGGALRYMAGVGVQNQPASVIVTCPSIDNSKILQFIAQQASASDGSIWYITVLPTQIPSSGNVVFQLIEGNNAPKTFSVKEAMYVELPGADGGC